MVPVFAERGVTLLGLGPDEPVPDRVQVLLDGPEGDERSVPVRADAEATLLAVAQRLDDRPTARGGYSEVVFGIDPGATIGLAVVCDGAAFLTAHAHDVAAAAERIAAWSTGLDAHRFRIHVGDGAPEIRDALMDALSAAVPDASVHRVREDRTSPNSPITDSRHTDAAIHIALRRP